jgi:hypothetical protein
MVGLVLLHRDQDWWHWRQALGLLGLSQEPCRHDRPGPHCRWEGLLVQIFGSTWKSLASKADWPSRLGIFIDQAHAVLRVPCREQQFPRREQTIARKPPARRIPFWELSPWAPSETRSSRFLIEILGDNLTVINCLNEDWAASKHNIRGVIVPCQKILHIWFRAGICSPRLPWEAYCTHMFRELNREADELSRKYTTKFTVTTLLNYLVSSSFAAFV